MATHIKYFMWNKQADFDRGWTENAVWQGDGMRLTETQASGVFFSRLLDSREKQSTWHRIRLRAKSLGDSSIRFTFYASEERVIRWDGGVADIDTLIHMDMDAGEKQRIMAPYAVVSLQNPVDALLHQITGRYLWFCAALFGQGEESPVLEYIRIDLPRKSWIQYLPEIYQTQPESQSFVERYLCIFQSLHEDLEEEVRRMPARFDPAVTDGEFLQWLAGWISIEDGYIWPEEKLRYLVQNGMALYAKRGTRQGIADMVALYTGEPPYIVEQHQLTPYRQDAANAAHLRQLYGDSSFLFTVVVNEQSVPDVASYRTLLKIIEHAKPAHMEVNVVVLKPYIFLDKYSYLGINSVLGQYRAMQLDGLSALPFTGLM